MRAPGRIKFERWSVSSEREISSGPCGLEIVVACFGVKPREHLPGRFPPISGDQALVKLQQPMVGPGETIVGPHMILGGPRQLGPAVDR